MIDISHSDDGKAYRCRRGHTRMGQDNLVIRGGGSERVTAAVCLTCVAEAFSSQFGMEEDGGDEPITAVAPEPKREPKREPPPTDDPAELPTPAPIHKGKGHR